MNIWDPIWKQDKEDNIDTPIYKMKPVEIKFNSIRFPVKFYKYNQIVTQKVYFDIEFYENYINTLDVDKRRLWVLDDGGCVVKCKISSRHITNDEEWDYNKGMERGVQRKWVVSKITNGVRITIDLPRYTIQPENTTGLTTSGQASYTYTWDFGKLKLLIPEPMRFDGSVVRIAARFEYTEITDRLTVGNWNRVYSTDVIHTMDVDDYKVLTQLQFESNKLVALHKFTIESASNLIDEVKDVVSVPVPTLSYKLEDHPEYPITYAKVKSNNSIGSSSRPKGECSKKGYPIHPKVDQTQLKGRSLIKLGIVGKILSMIKRRKREIK